MGILSVRATRRTLAVAVVDLSVIVALLWWGLHTHGTNPTQLPLHAVMTVTPFLVGWACCAPVLGAYAETAFTRLHWALPATLGAWIGAALVGGALRATTVFPGGSPPVFLGVVIGMGAGVLLPWRVLVVLIDRA